MEGFYTTAKQTCLGSLLGLELNLYCVLILSFWCHPCQLDLSQRRRATHPQSSSNEWLKSCSQMGMWLVQAELALSWGVVATWYLANVVAIHNMFFFFLSVMYFVPLIIICMCFFQPVEVAIRKLNELGVFTIFVILDSLSKVSTTCIMLNMLKVHYFVLLYDRIPLWRSKCLHLFMGKSVFAYSFNIGWMNCGLFFFSPSFSLLWSRPTWRHFHFHST